MKGTERQVAWAVEIREELLDQLDEARDKAGDAPTPEDYTSTWDDIERAIRTCDDARVLIDNRGWYLNFARCADEDIIDASFAELTANLPALRGTEKQVAWAERLRLNAVREMVAAPYRSSEFQKKRLPEDLISFVRRFTSIDNAPWLIDNVQDTAMGLLTSGDGLPFLSPEQSELVAPLLGSQKVVLAAEVIRAKLIHVLLAGPGKRGERHPREAELLEMARECNSAAAFLKANVEPTYHRMFKFEPKLPKPLSVRRFEVENIGHNFKLTTGPYADCYLEVDFELLIAKGDGWIDYAVGETVGVSEKRRDWSFVPVDDVQSASDDPKLPPPVWNGVGWQRVHIPAADVEEHDKETFRVTLRCSEAEGLYLFAPKDRIESTRVKGTLAFNFPGGRDIALYGGAKKRMVSPRWLFHDRTNPRDEPGESLLVEWTSIPVHSSRLETLRGGKAVALDFPDDHDLYPGWRVYHPAKLAQYGYLRAHEEWLWRITPDNGEPVEVNVAEITELLSPWATTPKVKGRVLTDGKVTITEPVRLAELERVGVLDDLADDL